LAYYNEPELEEADLPTELVDAFVEAHPSGATYEEIGGLLGCTPERIRQIVYLALGKALKKCHACGIDLDDLPSERTSIWDRIAGN